MVYFFKILQRCAHIYLWILLFCYSCSRARESERYKTRSKYTTHHITIWVTHTDILNITQQQNKSKEEYTPSAWNRLTDTQTNDIIISFDLRKKIARSYISTILLKDFGFAQDLPSQLILLFSTRHNSLSNSTVDTYRTLLIVVCRRN